MIIANEGAVMLRGKGIDIMTDIATICAYIVKDFEAEKRESVINIIKESVTFGTEHYDELTSVRTAKGMDILNVISQLSEKISGGDNK